MSEIGEFASEQFTKLKNAYAEEFPDDVNLHNSAMVFSLMLAQYISDVLEASDKLPENYGAALLELLNHYTKNYIDIYRTEAKLNSIDWDAGKDLLKKI